MQKSSLLTQTCVPVFGSLCLSACRPLVPTSRHDNNKPSAGNMLIGENDSSSPLIPNEGDERLCFPSRTSGRKVGHEKDDDHVIPFLLLMLLLLTLMQSERLLVFKEQGKGGEERTLFSRSGKKLACVCSSIHEATRRQLHRLSLSDVVCLLSLFLCH